VSPRLRTLGQRLRRDEGGFTVVELVAAAGIGVVMLFSVFAVFAAATRTTNATQELNESQQRTRHVLERLARDMRNLASPTPEQPQAIDKATSYDLVFQSVDPAGPNLGANTTNVRRVRYCLDSAAGAEGRIWIQTQTWETAGVPAMPSTSACPSAAWATERVVAQRVSNRSQAPERPLFTFNSTVLPEVNSVRVELFSNAGTAKEPRQGRLVTEMFLRNQNREPSANFTATAAGNQRVLLNGSGSTDPEGQELNYAWYDGAELIGNGITLDYTAPATGERSLTLKVYDPAGLVGISAVQVVNVT
jgi:hypothetical protein